MRSLLFPAGDFVSVRPMFFGRNESTARASVASARQASRSNRSALPVQGKNFSLFSLSCLASRFNPNGDKSQFASSFSNRQYRSDQRIAHGYHEVKACPPALRSGLCGIGRSRCLEFSCCSQYERSCLRAFSQACIPMHFKTVPVEPARSAHCSRPIVSLR